MQTKANKRYWTLFIIVLAIMIATLKVMSLADKGIGDSDYYWHLTLGEYILRNGTIPKQDVFSWLAIQNGYFETAHSWLGSIILYLFSQINSNVVYGAALYVFATAAVLTFTVIRLWGSPFNGEENSFLNLLYAIALTLCVSSVHMAGRPNNISFIFFTVTLHAFQRIYDKPESCKKYLILLPVISILWANIHGGTVPILLAFNVMYIVLSIIPGFRFWGFANDKPNRCRTKKLGIAFISNTIAALINPYSYKLFIYFFVTNNEVTKKYIQEWQPSALMSFSIILAIAVLLITFAVPNKTIKLTWLAPVGATLLMAAKYGRIQSFLVLTIAAYCFLFLSENAKGFRCKKLKAAHMDKDIILIGLCTVVFLVATVNILPNFANDPEKTGDHISTELQATLDEYKPKRMYSSYNTGGFLIYHGYESFLDSRADLFADEDIEDGIRFTDLAGYDTASLKEFIARYDFDALLLEEKGAASIWAELSPEWNLVFHDDSYKLFVRADTDEEVMEA